MKALVTIDYWDQTPGKQKEIHLENLHGNQIALALASKNVACITITRPIDLRQMAVQDAENKGGVSAASKNSVSSAGN